MQNRGCRESVAAGVSLVFVIDELALIAVPPASDSPDCDALIAGYLTVDEVPRHLEQTHLLGPPLFYRNPGIG